MAFTIDSNQNITVFKGDTISFTVRLKNDAVFTTGDYLIFTVKKEGSSTPLFTPIEQYTFSADFKEAIINITHDDTNKDAGVYVYTLIYNTLNNQTHHLVPNICDGTAPTFKICEV